MSQSPPPEPPTDTPEAVDSAPDTQTEAEAEAEAEAEVEDNPSLGGWLLELLKSWGPAILAIIVLRTFVFQLFNIPSTSMVPTLLIGDYVLVSKYSYGLWVPNPIGYERWQAIDWASPKRGDVIVFRWPKNKALHYIKRVAAVAGDQVEVRDNQVVINGIAQDRESNGTYAYDDADCVRPKTATFWTEHLSGTSHAKLTDIERSGTHRSYGPVTVPPGKVFVMGDNRDNSGDSREWGFVDHELIMGKAHFIAVSFDHCGGSFPPTFRWDRVGQGLYGEVLPTHPSQ